MRISRIHAAFVACALLGLAASAAVADQQAATGAAAGSGPDAGYGARSLRGLTALHLEVVGESTAAPAAAAEETSTDPIKLLEGLLGSRSSKQQPAPASLTGDAKTALQSRTSIKLHEGSLDQARAAGTAYLVITVQDGPADANGKSPFDLTLELHQQAALARDPKLTFYATTYDDRIAEPAGGRDKREVLRAVMDRFIEFWRAAN